MISTLLFSQGLSRLALDEFRSAQECFPNVFDFNDIGAQLLLVCGYPELALTCAEGCLLDSTEKAALVEKTGWDSSCRRNYSCPRMRRAPTLFPLGRAGGILAGVD